MGVYKQLFGAISTEQRLHLTEQIHSKHRIQLAEIKRASTRISSVSITTPITKDDNNYTIDARLITGPISGRGFPPIIIQHHQNHFRCHL